MHIYPYQASGWDAVAWWTQALTRVPEDQPIVTIIAPPGSLPPGSMQWVWAHFLNPFGAPAVFCDAGQWSRNALDHWHWMVHSLCPTAEWFVAVPMEWWVHPPRPHEWLVLPDQPLMNLQKTANIAEEPFFPVAYW